MYTFGDNFWESLNTVSDAMWFIVEVWFPYQPFLYRIILIIFSTTGVDLTPLQRVTPTKTARVYIHIDKATLYKYTHILIHVKKIKTPVSIRFSGFIVDFDKDRLWSCFPRTVQKSITVYYNYRRKDFQGEAILLQSLFHLLSIK